jgi:hypothetical protein
MKRFVVVSAVVFNLLISPCFAIEYCKDFLEGGNPGGWNGSSLKTWDETWTMNVGQTVDMDIWVNDAPEALLTGGFAIIYDPVSVALTNVIPYDTSNGGPWDAGITGSESEPGQLYLAVGNFGCVTPDGDGDVILAKVTFECLDDGNTTITILTIPAFDTVCGCSGPIIYDSQISPNNVTIFQTFVDTDSDGIPNHEDNCLLIPNGPELGTCLYGTVGETCNSSQECDPNGFCSMNQEDRDRDNVGDVCDDITMCKGNFDYDGDVDGTDAALFKEHFGRSAFNDPCPSDGPAPVEKTWQTVAHASGDDGFHQRGVAYPLPRFTDNADGTVKDNLTGLIWLKDAGCFNATTWFNALLICNSLADGSCGLTDRSSSGDWRLPNYKELISLVDVETDAPVLPSGHPFNNVQTFYYWTSTSFYQSISNAAWLVGMHDGDMEYLAKSNFHYLWPVRGGH